MGKIIKLKNKHTVKELKQAIKRIKDKEQKTRLRAILGLKNGQSKTEVANNLAVGRTSVIAWVKYYNAKGIPGLFLSKGGRPEGNPKWNKEIFKKLTKEVGKSDKCWSIPMMRDWIIKEEKKEIPPSTIWYHLQILNFSYKSLRPHPYLGDKEKQEIFKKRD